MIRRKQFTAKRTFLLSHAQKDLLMEVLWYSTQNQIEKKKKGRHEQNGSVIRDVFYVKYVILLQTRLTQLWHNVPLRELKWS